MILELFTIISASILEGIVLQRGNTDIVTVAIKEKPVVWQVTFSLWFLATALCYIVYSIVWCFSEVPIERFAGLFLIGLTCLGILLKGLGWEKKSWYIQLDAMLSLVLLILVGYNLLRK